ncbi:MAG: RagB/SusD family nutrient uptake outer membrane protein, partial [Duncaniella sp.]|nr:RagB/SusD family nutrient uptake outer membrane protein [Duncaniella sp.]
HDVAGAQTALLVVAKRNPVYQSVADLPSSEDELMAFLQDERARELFQEGHRLYDLRRWDVKADVYATSPSNVAWMITGYDISDLVFPIPDAEINAGFGVTQNEGWQNTFPKK